MTLSLVCVPQSGWWAFQCIQTRSRLVCLPSLAARLGNKIFSFFQLSRLGYWAFLHSTPVRDWFCLRSLSSQVGRLILSVRLSQFGCRACPCSRLVRDLSDCNLSAVRLGDKIFLLFRSSRCGCWAFSASKPDRDWLACHLSAATLSDHVSLVVVLPAWLGACKHRNDIVLRES